MTSEFVQEQVLMVMAKVYLDAPDSQIPEKYLAAVHELRASKPASFNPHNESLRSERRTQKQKVSPTGLRRGENQIARPPKYSRKKIVEAWNATDDKRLSVVAAQIGCHKQTVHRALVEQGIIVPNGKGGAKPKDKCRNGHDNWRQVYKNGVKNGRYCVTCKAEVGAATNARRTAERRAAREAAA